MLKKNLIVIVGPTAIGKTTLSIEIAKAFNCPVISADSRQFFKELNIGTAKPGHSEMKGVPHYFINSHSIKEEYNVGKYENEVLATLDTLFKDHPVVVMVGGSGLYVDAVCKGFDELPEADAKIRKSLTILLESKGIEGLQELLKQLDPVYYAKVDLKNPQRLTRALEVCLTTGQPFSGFRKGTKKVRDFNCIKIGLNTSREVLYSRINNRVDEMMEAGLLNEVKRLKPYKHLNALQTVGYKELFDCMGDLEATSNVACIQKSVLNKATTIIKQNTRRFAKRQLTWFRRDTEISWFEPNEINAILKYIKGKAKVESRKKQVVSC